MMLITRRIASLALMMTGLMENQVSSFSPAVVPTPNLRDITGRRPFLSSITLAAAPGIQLDSQEEIKEALSNPKTVVLDTRTVDEIAKDGLLKTPNNQWVHAPCTPDECKLLSVASTSLIRDKSAPVVVYCASGKRAAKAKETLESQGYKYVFNAGGFPGDIGYLQ